MRLVAVTWEDACEIDTTPWAYLEETEYECKTVVQVGWVVEETEKYIVLTHAHTQGQVARRNLIPRSSITKIVTLQYE